MIVLACNNIRLSYGVENILHNITFSIQNNEKVGIVGVNGAGKSTLFKILTGRLEPDEGDILLSKNYKLGYLDQNTGLTSNNTILDELTLVYSDLIRMEARIKELEGKISHEKNDAALSSLMKEYATLTEAFTRTGGYTYKSQVRGVLRGLGFEESQFGLSIQALSGGQKTRLALAKLLLEEPDILLLDEPTNHLDIDALEWLEDFLKGYSKTIVVISHDRYFLDAVTMKTIEIENGQCKMYNGNYSSFITQKISEREIQQKHFENQQKEIARMESYIEQQRRWNREKNIIAAESRQKAIDRMEKVAKPQALPDKIKIKFRSSIISGNDVLFVEKLSKAYPGKPLFNDINFKMRRKEKVFLLGPNGCGKSTLLKILAGKLESSGGNFEYGHNIKIGYYDQELTELDDTKSVLDEVWDFNEKLTQSQIRNTLASFLFKGDDVFKIISTLSGGEKSRVSLVKLMLSGSNCIFLDEPTNHLDIHSREVLEESLSDFDGTILAISHDRYFIKKLASRIIEFNNQGLADYHGDYAFYLETKSKMRKIKLDTQVEESLTQSKQEHRDTKEERAKKRKTEKQLLETENEIHSIEARLSEITAQMCLQETACNHILLLELQQENDALNIRLETLYEIWGELTSQNEM